MRNRPRLCVYFILIIYSLIKCEEKKTHKEPAIMPSLWKQQRHHHPPYVHGLPYVSSLSSTFLYAYVSSLPCLVHWQECGANRCVWCAPGPRFRPAARSGRGRETKNGRWLRGRGKEKMTTSWCISPSCYNTAVVEVDQNGLMGKSSKAERQVPKRQVTWVYD